jgi:hypothetical protein
MVKHLYIGHGISIDCVKNHKYVYSFKGAFIVSVDLDIFERDRKGLVVRAQCCSCHVRVSSARVQQQSRNLVTTVPSLDTSYRSVRFHVWRHVSAHTDSCTVF